MDKEMASAQGMIDPFEPAQVGFRKSESYLLWNVELWLRRPLRQ